MDEPKVRVLYNSETGIVEKQTFIYDNSETPDYKCIDLPLDIIDHTKSYIESINPETDEPIIKDYPLRPDQLENAKLKEDIILLQADAETGGIL